jgi:hypothetical protein
MVGILAVVLAVGGTAVTPVEPPRLTSQALHTPLPASAAASGTAAGLTAAQHTDASKQPGSSVARGSTKRSWLGDLWAEPTSGYTRSSEVRRGTFIYTDPVFDDRGANTDGTSGGDAAYPADGAPYMRNAADLVEVRLRRSGDALAVGVRLNTLLDPDVPIAAVGITDPSARGVARSWPFGAAVSATDVRWVVTLRHPRAIVTDLLLGTSTSFPLTLRDGTKAAERQLENTLSAQIPLRTLDARALEGQFKIVAAAGVRNKDVWLAGASDAPAPFDVSLTQEIIQWADGKGTDGAGDWEQSVQSDVLAAGDISRAKLAVDGAFRSQPVRVPVDEARTRIYRPSIEMRTGEGIENNPTLQLAPSADGTPAQDVTRAPLGNFYRGLYLPYSVWIPKAYGNGRRALPLVVNLHGITGNHQSHLFPNWHNGEFNAETLAISPLGRSEYGFYQREAALDVFEAIADVKRALNVDADRVLLSGYSMGGVGTYTLATSRPDLFAAAVPVAGPGTGTEDVLFPVPREAVPVVRDVTGLSRMGSFGRELLPNALNVPFRIWHATADEYVAQTYSEGDAAEWEKLGYDYQFANFTTRTHVIVAPYINALYHQILNGCSSAVAGCDDEVFRAGPYVRDRNPARVVFKAVPYMWAPQLELRYNGAYWVSDMALRSAPSSQSFALVDVTSSALAHKSRQPGEALPLQARTFEPTGDLYRFQGRRWTFAPQQRQQSMQIKAQNLLRVTLDMSRMGLRTDRTTVIKAMTDGPTSAVLRGPWRNGSVWVLRRGGQKLATVRAGAGVLTIALPTGEGAYQLVPS